VCKFNGFVGLCREFDGKNVANVFPFICEEEGKYCFFKGQSQVL